MKIKIRWINKIWDWITDKLWWMEKVWDLFRYDIPNFFKNLWYFKKILWNYRTWDFHYTLQIMLLTIIQLRNSIDNGYEIDESRNKKVQQMARVIELLENHVNDNFIKQAEKVQYLDSVYTLHINSARKIKEDFMLKNCSKCMLTKFSEWKYEKEWRIIFKPLKAFQYPIGVMKSVYFGLRTTEEDIHKVREASKHHTGLRYYMATLKPHEYNVVFNEMIFKD